MQLIRAFFESRRMKKQLTVLMNELELLYNERPYNLSKTVKVTAQMAELKAEMKRKGYING